MSFTLRQTKPSALSVAAVTLVATISFASRTAFAGQADRRSVPWKPIPLQPCAEANTQHLLDIAISLGASNGDKAYSICVLKKGADPNALDVNGFTPLWNAMSNHHYDLADVLLQHGARVDRPDQHGRTLLILASKDGDAVLVKQLLKRRADVNYRSNLGLTALMAAAAMCRTEVARILIAHGANTSLRNNDSKSALDLALQGPAGFACPPIVKAIKNAPGNSLQARRSTPS